MTAGTAMDIGTALIAIGIMAAVTFGTRIFPFVVFRRHKPGRHFKQLQKELPAMIMLILVVYSVKDYNWLNPAQAATTVGCIAVVAALQWWKRNPLISIFSGVVIFMLLSSFF